MRILSKRRLRAFWEAPNQGDAAKELAAWFRNVSKAVWNKWSDVRATYGNASKVGDCVVFDIKGNDYRLVVKIDYGRQRVYVKKVMTHKEYDKNRWQYECGCYLDKSRPKSKGRK